jgi:L-lactate dehydrogenase complex protein LldE
MTESTGKRSVRPATRRDDPPYQSGETVALFIPCYIDQFYPEVGEATVRLMEKYGAPIVFPERQTCCGQPAFNSGYWEDSRKVVRQFCDAFDGQRWIVTPSGSCAAMCRVFFGLVDSDPRVVETGRRVFELTEFLVDMLGVTDTGATYPRKVAMHIGCHTRRELGVVDQPMTLLRSIRGLEYRELPEMEDCCGFGGTFSVKMPGMSLSMGKTKVDNIVKSGADVVVSPDISCLMHVGGMMRRTPEAKHIEIKHIAELLVS